MIKIDMKAIQASRDAADLETGKASVAWNHAFTAHSEYVPALKAIKSARDQYEALRNWMATIVTTLQADPSVHDDNEWYPKIGAIQAYATQKRDLLEGIRVALVKAMAGYISLAFSPADQSGLASASPEAAAAAVDAKAKATDPNPNARNPSSQSTDAPPVDVPPGEGESKPWGLYAGLAAGGALLLKILKVW